MPTIRQRLVSFLTRSMSPNNPATPLSAIAKWLGAGSSTVAGEQIDEQIAMTITTVQTCVKVLAESVASLPCNLYEKTSKGKQVAEDRDLHYLLSVEPNNEMSAFTFWETMVGCSALTGNSYAEIKWTKFNQVGELYPLHPLVTEPIRKNGKLVYRTRQGMPNGQWREINSEDILHFKLFSLDGLKGLSPIALARQSLGLTRAAEKFGAKFFGNGSKPGGILSNKNEDMDDEQLNDARQAWEAAQGGSNQGRTAVLSGEWTYTKIGLSPEESQFLLTRSFQRAEIAAMFRVPAHMAGDTSKISNSSYEQMTLSFVNDTLRPILVRIEQELRRKLLHQVGRKANLYTIEFDVSERLRADHETTMKGIALGRQWGIMGADEGRIALGMNPIGDNTRLVPVNMMNAELIPTQDTIPNGNPGGSSATPGDDDTETQPKGKSRKPKASGLSEDEEEAEGEPEAGE